MSTDREVAEALSDGLNVLATIVAALSHAAPPVQHAAPEWPVALQAMERALETIASKQVRTSLVVGADDIELVRRVGGLVSEWASLAQPPRELRGLAEAVLVRFGLHAPSAA